MSHPSPTPVSFPATRRSAPWLCAIAAAALTACGGGREDSSTPDLAVSAASTPSQAADADVLAQAAAVQAQPAFHSAPVILDAPDDGDALDPNASALRAPHAQQVPASLAALGTQRLTLDQLEAVQRSVTLSSPSGEKATPQAAASTVLTYTPAQIRAAYGMPALPAPGALLTPAQAAALGAGQTVYIVNAYHDPNAAAELAEFNTKFGLPTCTTKSVPAGTPLPLPTASTSGCEFVQVYASISGTQTATVPRYDAGWATEIALDVQWVHATAPLARVVLIEAADASVASLQAAIKLANAMGPGVVSMSFGAPEGTNTAALDVAFTTPKMTYLAATGDSGVSVSWPSVSTNVVAVGGTTLSWSGTARSETAWSGTGGGVSAYTALPGYQTSAVPGFTGYARRVVADVAFNADPNSGQYVAVISPGSTVPAWRPVGGTSLATPQWAGLVAVANAQRALAGKVPLGAPHSALYGQIGAVPGNYASAFLDVTQGSHGSCTLCKAKAGYDELTGLGSPNVSGLLAQLTGLTAVVPAPTPPAVAAANVTGQPGVALSFTVGVTAPNAVTYTLTDAPAGMTINAGGVIAWANPVAGSHAVTVTAKDVKTGLTGQAQLTFSIVVKGPMVTASPITGVAGKALTSTIIVADATAPVVFVNISGARPGMLFSFSSNYSTVTLRWASPVTGDSTLVVSVLDAAGQTTSASIPVTITAK